MLRSTQSCSAFSSPLAKLLRSISVDHGFIGERRGLAASEHKKVLAKTVNLMTSKQMAAFKTSGEPKEVKERYGTDRFGRG